MPKPVPKFSCQLPDREIRGNGVRYSGYLSDTCCLVPLLFHVVAGKPGDEHANLGVIQPMLKGRHFSVPADGN